MIYHRGGAGGTLVIVVENGLSDPSSNPGRLVVGCLSFMTYQPL